MHLYRLTRSVIIGHLHDYRVSLELLWNDFAVSSVDLLNKISQLKPMLGRIYTSLAFVYLSTAWLALAIGDPWEKKAGHCNSVERDCFWYPFSNFLIDCSSRKNDVVFGTKYALTTIMVVIQISELHSPLSFSSSPVDLQNVELASIFCLPKGKAPA